MLLRCALSESWDDALSSVGCATLPSGEEVGVSPVVPRGWMSHVRSSVPACLLRGLCLWVAVVSLEFPVPLQSRAVIL